MILTKAMPEDLGAVCTHYRRVAESMEARGLHQWHWGDYPTEEMLEQDIARGEMYLVRGEEGIRCAVCVNCTQDEPYLAVDWLLGVKPGLFHRLGVAPECQGRGLSRSVIREIEAMLRDEGCDCLRCDTYSLNDRALRLYDTNGMRRSGEIFYPGRPMPFICFEKPLTSDCPLLPLPMRPAFRGGALTPWGGEKLRDDYGKPIREVPTGESLEVSCIPGLESTDPMGVTLPELIARWGARLAGRYAEGAFPLLLKLLDARESLSVQVHPGNEYARLNEGGKLGKTEAWLILDAPEGSELVYGIVPGVTLEQLRAACEKGSAVEPLLRRVRVKPGDVCFIPAGCVHAIGAGILLYEIQQSSDVTYRFYDWDRTDSQGRKRELHLGKALDVTDLDFSLSPMPAPDAPCVRMLDVTYFTLDLLHAQGDLALPAIGDFGLLTALDGGLTLKWQGSEKPLRKGESLFLPASCPALTLTGSGRAALSMPK